MLLKKFRPLVIGCILRTAGSSFIYSYADPFTLSHLLIYYLALAMSSCSFAYYIIQRNATTNDSIFHMSGLEQSNRSKIISWRIQLVKTGPGTLRVKTAGSAGLVSSALYISDFFLSRI